MAMFSKHTTNGCWDIEIPDDVVKMFDIRTGDDFTLVYVPWAECYAVKTKKGAWLPRFRGYDDSDLDDDSM